jgi:aspartate kinase
MQKPIVVKKFGGTSVADPSRIRGVAQLIQSFRQKEPDTQLVVVVSAMAGETNRLIELARSCAAQPSPRELDVIAMTGEQVSIGLMALALQQLNIPARSFTGSQAGIQTTAAFTDAKVKSVDTRELRAALDRGEVAVVAGFQGMTQDGELTTLGRGGSDITAVALAAALNARECYIYTDVDGVYSADPRVCPQAKLRHSVTHEEMLELASVGAKVLHPRSVQFAHRYNVPLVTLSSFKPGSGTWVVSEEARMESALVTGITSRADEACVFIRGIPGGTKNIAAIFAALSRAAISIDIISQTSITDDLTDLSFTTPDDKSSAALALCDALIPELGAMGATIDRNIARVSVVGIGLRQTTDVASQIFGVLANAGIEVQMTASSEIRISVVVPRKYAELAVRVLHERLVENCA